MLILLTGFAFQYVLHLTLLILQVYSVFSHVLCTNFCTQMTSTQQTEPVFQVAKHTIVSFTTLIQQQKNVSSNVPIYLNFCMDWTQQTLANKLVLLVLLETMIPDCASNFVYSMIPKLPGWIEWIRCVLKNVPTNTFQIMSQNHAKKFVLWVCMQIIQPENVFMDAQSILLYLRLLTILEILYAHTLAEQDFMQTKQLVHAFPNVLSHHFTTSTWI